MPRAWLWVQVAAAWLPVWALFTILMMDVHELPLAVASVGALQLIVAAAILAYPVYLFARLHPHFLFNALHTVVQLIPVDPRGAARAAEELGAALRTAVDEERDIVPLAEEWVFVERYLAIESIRFGERLVVRPRIGDDALEARLPSFALQTLVENAVIHGAQANEGSTVVAIEALLEGPALRVTVCDDGVGGAGEPGTGLRRLRERLRGLYGDRASLSCRPRSPKGFEASLTVPQDPP